MKPEELRSRFGGVVAFPVTPFKKDLSLDVEGLRKNLQHTARFPFCAVVAGGGTGELYSLDVAELRKVVEEAVAIFGGKVPVIAGAGGSLPIAQAMARAAAEAGADGILALPPYYPSPSDDGIVEYYKAIGAATPLGLLVYGRDWFNPGPELVARLASSIPTLVAWKDGQGDLRRYQMIRQRVGDRLYWIGGAGDDMVPGLLRHGDPDVHLQHRHRGPGAVHGPRQGGGGRGRGDAEQADERLRHPAVCPARAQEGLRGDGDEGGDGRGRPGGRGACARRCRRSRPRRRRRSRR